MGLSVPKEAERGGERQPELWPSPPERLVVRIEVTDPEVLSELWERPAGPDRDRYAREALRLGVLSLRTASGRIDAGAVSAAGERLVADVRELLAERASEITGELAGALTRYFDPESGLVSQRIEALVRRDGELARLLESHVGGDESLLARTLAAHLGQKSPLFRLLSPTEAEGVKVQLEKSVEAALLEQREHILKEFSLDRRDSALRRLVEEVEVRHHALRSDLGQKVSAVVEEFSLDQPNSALSRLVGRVEAAQLTITSEFSLDREGSALHRMARMIEELRTELCEKLSALRTQREEAERSTAHGLAFEEALGQVLARLAQRRGDVWQATGTTTGTIKNCKVGDGVIELGPESAAPGARVVWEAKEAAGVDLRRALAEIEQARKNRSAQVGIFVFSARTAPPGLEAFARYGDDLVVVWDPDAPETDVYLDAAFAAARALVLRERDRSGQAEEAIGGLERATRAVEKQIRYLEEIRKMAETTRSSGEKIGDRARRMAEDLTREVERIDEHLSALRVGDSVASG